MVDVDDVGDGFLYGGVFIGLILLAIYFVYSKPEIDACTKAGGVMVKANGEAVCVRKDALIPKYPAKASSAATKASADEGGV
jgi:hypothetical protein